MIFKRFDGFEITPTDTVTKTLADARIKVEELQAAETGQVCWYINVVSPAKKYLGVVLSDAMKLQFPTLDQEIELFDGLKMETDLATINSRIDALIVQLTGMVSAPASLSDKTAGVTTGILTDIASTVPEWAAVANNQRCILGTKIYVAFIESGKIKIGSYDMVDNIFNVVDTNTNSVTTNLSIAPDPVNNDLYLLDTFESSLYDPDTNNATDSTFYKFDIDTSTMTLLQVFNLPLLDPKICYKAGKIYLAPCAAGEWSEADWCFIPTIYDACISYTIATESIQDLVLQANKYPTNYVVKYPATASDTTNHFFEVLPSLHGENVELWTWYFGDPLASKLLTYNRYEMNSTMPYGIAVCLNASKEYVIKNVWRSDVNYLLIHNVTSKVVKRVVLSGSTKINPDSVLTCVGTKLFIFDPNVLTKVSTLDLTPYL